MLRVSRDEVVRFLKSRDIPFVEDSTNSLDIFVRNKIRHAVIPVIKELNPGFNEAASAAAEIARADEEYLSGLADAYIEEHCVDCTIDAKKLLALPFSISGRVIRKLCGGKLSYKHVKAVLKLCESGNPSSSLSLPGATARREYDLLVFESASESPEEGPEGSPEKGKSQGIPGVDGKKPIPTSFQPIFDPIFLTDGASETIPALGLKISCKTVVCNAIIERANNDKINKSFTSYLFKSIDICGKISVRSRREGDSIRFSDKIGRKTLKKLFIEKRIPVRKRGLVPIVADEESVLAIYGLGIGDRAAPSPGDLAIQIDFEQIT